MDRLPETQVPGDAEERVSWAAVCTLGALPFLKKGTLQAPTGVAALAVALADAFLFLQWDTCCEEGKQDRGVGGCAA